MARRGDNIRKRKDGRWEGRYRYMQANGLVKYRSVYGKTYNETKKKLEQMQLSHKEIEQSIPECHSEIKSNDLNFSDIVEEWLFHIKTTRKHSTYVKYFGVYNYHIREAITDLKVTDIDNQIISERIFLKQNQKYRMTGSINRSIYSIINQSIEYANESYHCYIPILKIKIAKESSRPVQIINRSEQSILIPFLYKNMDLSKLGIILCISTGLRLGEICALKWEDIDLSQKVIHVNRTVQRIAVENAKTKTTLMETSPKSVFSKREIPLSNQITDLLIEYHTKEEYCLCGVKPMEPRTYQNRFKSYLREAKIKEYNFHTLRHTFATNCIDNGMDVKSLSEILGHSDVQITLNRYVHPTMDTKRKYMSVLSAVYGQYCGQESEKA